MGLSVLIQGASLVTTVLD